MKGINKAILVGIVGQDPEVKNQKDLDIANFSLATTESFKQGEEWKDITEWHNVVAFRGLAKYVEKAITKGTAIYVEGKIKTRSYDKDGVKMYRTEIIADTISVLKKKDSSGSKSAEDIANEQSEDDDLPF